MNKILLEEYENIVFTVKDDLEYISDVINQYINLKLYFEGKISFKKLIENVGNSCPIISKDDYCDSDCKKCWEKALEYKPKERKMYIKDEFPVIGKYKRNENRIYTILDFKDGENIELYDFDTEWYYGYARYISIENPTNIYIIHIDDIKGE